MSTLKEHALIWSCTYMWIPRMPWPMLSVQMQAIAKARQHTFILPSKSLLSLNYFSIVKWWLADRTLKQRRKCPLFFISDVPHLIKTVRNCWSNSFAHKCTQTMKVSVTLQLQWWNVCTLYWMDTCLHSFWTIIREGRGLTNTTIVTNYWRSTTSRGHGSTRSLLNLIHLM